MLAAGNPDAPPLVFFHGGGTFHGWAFAEPWTSSFRVLIPYHPGLRRVGRHGGPARHRRRRPPLRRALRPARLARGREPRRVLARRTHRRAVRDRPEAPLASPRARRAGRAPRPRRRGAGLLHDPARRARAAARPRHEHDPPVPARGSARRRLHRRPLPRDAHDGDHHLGAAVRPGAREVARPRSTSRRSSCGETKTGSCRPRSHPAGQRSFRTRGSRRSRTRGTSCSTSRRTHARPWRASAHRDADVRGAAARHRRRHHELDLARARRLRSRDRHRRPRARPVRPRQRPAVATATRRRDRVLRLLGHRRPACRIRRLACLLPGGLRRRARHPRRAGISRAHAAPRSVRESASVSSRTMPTR